VKTPVLEVTPEKIDEAVRRLVAAAHPRKIVLFGSQARGEAGETSDLDLMVVERHVENRIAESVRLHRALRGLLMPVDVLVVSEEQFSYWRDTPGTVYFEASNQGKVLYEAA
jgi:predicted nucleotidyltransferase